MEKPVFTSHFHACRKSDAATWAKRLTKAGFDAIFTTICDGNGNPGHGPGSMGWDVYVEGAAESYRDFRNAVVALDPFHTRLTR